MEIIVPALIFIAGFIIIIKSSDLFIDAAVWMSEVTGFSKAVIGATLVSFATTSPEYFVSLVAVSKGNVDMSIGNAVGSLAANLGIAFAALAILTPGVIQDKLFGLKGLMMIGAAVMLLIFCLNGTVSIIEGIVLFSIFLLFIFFNACYSKDGGCTESERKQTNKKEIAVNVLKFVAGAAGIIFASNLIVDNAVIIATFMNISEAVIGLTIIAIGTSLPEIVTSIAAVLKKHNAISIGNILGANIINISLILSTGAFVSGGNLTVSRSSMFQDIPLAILLMLMAVLPVIIRKRISRLQGCLMAGVYISYLAYLVIF